MNKRPHTTGRKMSAKAKVTLGRARFAKISAVEGIALTRDMKERASDFEKRGLSSGERRREIIRAHRKA